MQYNDFVGAVSTRAGIDPDSAARATDAVMTTLAERLTGDERRDLTSQLPTEPFGADEFLRRVAEREGVAGDDARAHVQVFAALREAVTPGEQSDVLAQLSADYGALVA
jgi:uncharacterized protein (DUF2267 family)